MNFKALIKPHGIIMIIALILSITVRVCMIDFENGEYTYGLLSVVFDVFLALGVYAFAKAQAGLNKAVIGFVIVLFLPTVLMNTAFGGRNAALYAPFVVWFLYLIYSKRYKLSLAVLGAGAVSDILLEKVFIAEAVSETSETPKLISYNYPGIWNILGLSYDTDAAWCVAFTCVALIALILFIRKKKADVKGRHLLWCAVILIYTCVLFLPGTHESSSYLYEILVLMIALTNPIHWFTLIALQLISLKTYEASFMNLTLNPEFLCIANVLVYAFVFYAFIREISGSSLITDLFMLAEYRDESIHRFAAKENFRPSKKDYFAIIILTGIFLLIGSMHLGRRESPSTYEEFGTETESGTEIYVSLNALQNVSSVCIYPLMSGSESFEIYYAEDGGWKKVEGEFSLKGVFTWKKIDVNVKTHQFCIIFSDPSVQIAEVAALDPHGNRISLKEGSEPAAVFDEQEMLPQTPTSFDSMIFDEIYHGRTAYEFLNGMKIYENTHPPLGKILISIGIRLFGMNPFGYRIIVLLFGVMCIPVIYLLALGITGDRRYAILAGVLQITEFMHFVLSRISTIDIIVAFFVLCMFYGCVGFIREEKYRYLVFSGVSFAFGIATKWTAAYAAAGIALILFIWMIKKIREKRKLSEIAVFILICIGSFIVFPAIVYVLSYVPFVKVYPEKNLIEHAVSNSIHMLEYHSNVTASHPYQSPWYSWLVDWIPLVDSRVKCGDKMGVVATFVNPFVCYAGLVSLFHHIYMAVKKKDVASALLITFYMSMLLPWVFITRTVFIYQYFICTKVLILMICRSIQCIGFKKENSVIKFTAGVSTALFVMFFPVLMGAMVKADYIDNILTLLPDWWF